MPDQRYGHSSRRRRAYQHQQQQKRLLLMGAAAIGLIILIVVLTSLFRKPADDVLLEQAATSASELAVQTVIPAATADPAISAATADPAIPAATVAPTITADPAATTDPAAETAPASRNDVADPAYAALRPTAKEGWLPIFTHVETDEKIIAITVDDCFQAENLREIINLAIANNGKLTFFPIGKVALRETQAELFRYAWEQGMEIENHTFNHNGLYSCSDENLANEIYYQNLAISSILGVEYQCHFLRPMGGDARRDQRIHAYIDQLGYYGVAHWSETGTRGIGDLKNSLAPGQIYLFHTTDKDLAHLKEFIPYAVSQGYRLVTLNEMFGYPPNEYTELTVPIEEHVVPPLEQYEKMPVTFSEGDYAYGVLETQARLVELGYLSSGVDGIYGKNTTYAVALFQYQNGLEVDGKATPETQEKLFAPTAPKNTQDPI